MDRVWDETTTNDLGNELAFKLILRRAKPNQVKPRRSERCEQPEMESKKLLSLCLAPNQRRSISTWAHAHTQTPTHTHIRTYTNLCLAIKLILMPPRSSVIFLGKSRKSYKEIGARSQSDKICQWRATNQYVQSPNGH